jgi:hypothetical protein
MPLALLELLPVGNAIRIFYNPPVAALEWRVLRKLADTFTGYNDAAASVVASNGGGNVQLDITGLLNGTPYFYKPYWFNGTTWTAEATLSATPAASFLDNGVDPLLLVRDRLDDGLQALIAASRIDTAATAIKVLTAPPLFDDVAWPVVTVHCNQDAAATRALGEMIASDAYDAVAEKWESSEGWLSRVQLSIVVWSLNPDERRSLRQAIKTIIQANLPVFYGVGLTEVEFQQADTEDFQSYNVPVYQVMCTFTCQAPSVTSSLSSAVMKSILVSVVY